MMGAAIFVLTLVVLYILSRIFIQKIFTLLYRLTKDKERAAELLGWIFLPGTFIHEVSHLLAALVLIVPFGKMNLMPEAGEGEVKLGSIQIARTDFIRGSIIGLAPLLVGVSVIFGAITYTFSNGHFENAWVVAGLIYLIFEISHTMFSSKKDLLAILELMVFMVILAIVLYYFKIFGPFDFIYQKVQEFGPFLQRLSYFLIIPIVFEVILIFL